MFGSLFSKAQKKKELDDRLKERQEQKKVEMSKFPTAASPEKNKGKGKGVKGEPKEDGPPVAPNYNEITLPKGKKVEIQKDINSQWKSLL